MNTVKIKLVNENPYTGLRRWKVSKHDAPVILDFLNGDTSKIRSYRSHKDGGFGFSSGVGYAIIDADLLGGTGSGEAENRFRDAGLSVVRY